MFNTLNTRPPNRRKRGEAIRAEEEQNKKNEIYMWMGGMEAHGFNIVTYNRKGKKKKKGKNTRISHQQNVSFSLFPFELKGIFISQ